MADNVNIIVQDTINDIVVNAAVVVETIDINVQAAVDVVDIVANPNNYVVNINRIIGEQVQSDWDQTDNQAPDYIKNKPIIPTATSDLTNNGSDGINPFITAADIPPVTGFVPYTGATANVDLGEYELKAGQVTLDTTPTGTAAVATTRWNDSIGTTETTLKGGSVVLKNGVDLVARVVNKVTPNATLTKAAYQAVRISGAQGQRLAVAYAQANNDNNSADTIGIVCETIATNQEGFILTVGQLEEINTTGSLQGETWADGDVLYLSPTTAGRLTNIKPTGATGHIVVMGYVEYAHAVHGKIYVKIMNGWELDELHNVYINSPANNEGLFYDSADSLWKNETIASALGYTPVTDARTISTTAPLSGGGDLSANRTLSITQATTSTDGYLSSTNWNTFNNKFTLPALTSGSVLFSDGTTIAQNNTNFFWNNSSIGLCLGGTTLDTNIILQINGTKGARISGTGAGFGYSLVRGSETSSFANSGSAGGLSSTTTLLFNTALTERMRINSSGNVLINTTTDGGFRLDVNGTARVNGNATFGTLGTGTGMFWDNTNNRLGIGTNAPTEKLTINGNAFISRTNTTTQVYIGLGTLGSVTPSALFWSFGLLANSNDFNIQSYDGTTLSSRLRIFTNGNIGINTTTDAGFKLDVNGTARVQTSISLANATGVGRIILPATGTTSADGIGFGDYFIHRSAAEKIRFSASNSSRYLEFTSLSTFSSITAAGATSQLNLTTNVTNSASVTIGSVNNNVTVARNGSQSNTLMFIRNGSLLSTGNILEIQNYLGTVALFDINGSLILGANNISTSAILQADSTTKGFLPPRMTTTQKNAIASPAAGLVVYDTTLNKLCLYTTTWETITSL